MNMFQIFRKEIDWEGKKLVLETGKVARQADGAVMASLGETTVLCTVVVVKSAKPGQVEQFRTKTDLSNKRFQTSSPGRSQGVVLNRMKLA